VLTPAERKSLETALAPLARLPEGKWRTAGAVPLASDEPLYLVKVDDSLRACVRPAEDGRLELVDLVRRELLERYFNGASEVSGSR
jgi:hypothetical protein